ncbi:MAG: class III poly(R)-hydroxyalkanoic acid synthase subunit PhaC [Gammaproteobacteria bacterium]|nr:class III poly(R)-hydroxyalkanoic acid synthase subunit PhaC [Gammaproteobacteria bacterium]
MIPVNIRPDQATQEVMEFGRKLGEGMKHLLELDEIETGVTDKETVYREDKLRLYHFIHPDGDAPTNPVPTLIVYALVNRPYMTDIQEDRSMVRGLLHGGQDVYLIDWGYPDRADRFLTLDDYINGYLDRCVDVLRERHGVDAVNVLGICQGGTFSLCYSALHGDKVRNLITMVTPVDFHTPDNLLGHWSKHVDVDLVVDTLGNVPGELLNWTYLMLKPYRLMGQKYLQMVDQLEQSDSARNFMRMEKWIFDSPDQAGEAFRQFMKDFFQDNKLIKGQVRLGGHTVDLGDITMPVLNVYATNDHLVPPNASIPLQNFVGTSDYREIAFKGGHIGIYVSGRAMREIPPAISEWLDARS